MKIRLLRRTTTVMRSKLKNSKAYPIGQVLQVTTSYGNKLIASGNAMEYKGHYPPREKMRTEFFKPKTNDN